MRETNPLPRGWGVGGSWRTPTLFRHPSASHPQTFPPAFHPPPLQPPLALVPAPSCVSAHPTGLQPAPSSAAEGAAVMRGLRGGRASSLLCFIP